MGEAMVPGPIGAPAVLILFPDEAGKHNPTVHDKPGPWVQCACGTSIYACTWANLAQGWMAHLGGVVSHG